MLSLVLSEPPLTASSSSSSAAVEDLVPGLGLQTVRSRSTASGRCHSQCPGGAERTRRSLHSDFARRVRVSSSCG